VGRDEGRYLMDWLKEEKSGKKRVGRKGLLRKIVALGTYCFGNLLLWELVALKRP
jgi:hypothetical protein